LTCEKIQKLQANISFVGVHDSIKFIGVTFANRSEGKSTVVCKLANIYAEKGKRSILSIWTSDIGHPSTHKILNIYNVFGVVEYVRGEAEIYLAIQHGANAMSFLCQ